MFHYNTNTLTFNRIKKYNEVHKKIKFINNKFKPTIKKTDDSDMLSMLDITDNNDYCLNIYPFYTIHLLKNIIANIFDLEWYKITLYWSHNNQDATTYTIHIHENVYNVSFKTLTVLDNYLYGEKNKVNISCIDEILTMSYFIENNIDVINFIYLDDHLDTSLIKESNIDYIYNSYVVKFFPSFTYNMFYNYCFNIQAFKERYTELINSVKYLSYFSKLFKLFKNKNFHQHEFKTTKLIWTFNDVIKSVSTINIRNIFDTVHIGEYDILKMAFAYYNKLYIKQNKYSDNVKIKKTKLLPNVLVLLIHNKYNEEDKPIYLYIKSDGSIEIEILISQRNISESLYNIKKHMLHITKSITDVLTENRYIYDINNVLDLLTVKNVLKCNIIHHIPNNKFTNIDDFNRILNKLGEFEFLYNNIEKEKYDTIKFYMYSCVSGFNEDQFYNFYPNKKNYYSIYSNLQDYEDWLSKHSGILIKILYSPNALSIFIYNIVYVDIPNILYILNTIINSIPVDDINKSANVDLKKKIKKLKSVDPNMFSFEKSLTSKKKYSKICQKPFHPNIYTSKEYKQLPDDLKSELVEYINSTTKDKVYYHCNNVKAPYLGFIVNEHPQNLCIPCCRVKSQENKKHHKQCIEDYSTSNKMNESNANIHNTYVLKHIADNRCSDLPEVLDIVFNKAFKNEFKHALKFYIYGIKGLTNSVNFCTDCNMNKLDLIHKYKINIMICDKTGNIDFTYLFNYETYVLCYFDGTQYYPIINNNKIKKYNKSSDIIVYLESMIHKHEKSMHSSFFTIYNLEKLYKIEAIITNNKNYIYGVIIKSMYVPVVFCFNSMSYTILELTENLIYATKESQVIEFLKKHKFLNKVTKHIYSNILKQYIGVYVVDGGQELVFMFKPISKSSIEIKDIFIIYYPIFELSDKIINKKYTTEIKEFKYSYYDIYYKNLYQYILQELSYHFHVMRDLETRERIMSFINNESDYNTLIAKITSLLPTIYDKIILLINNVLTLENNTIVKTKETIEAFKTQLYKNTYEFDDDIKYKFIQTCTFTNVTALFNKLFIFKPKKEINITNSIKNMQALCKFNSNDDGCCENNKLIIPLEHKNNFIQLFYNDVKNEFKQGKILNNTVYIPDFNDFDLRLNETVIIEPY